MKVILVTGSTGFLGTSFLKSLQKSKEDFTVVCLFFGQKGFIDDPRFLWIECNLLDISKHEELVRTIAPTYCVHFAWYVPPREHWYSLKNVEWVYASAHLFKLFCAYGGKVFLGAGSMAEYALESGVLDEDTTPLEPKTLYGQSKKSLFDILVQIRNAAYQDVILLWSRIGYVFGENQESQRLLKLIFNGLKYKTRVFLIAPDTVRPYIYVTRLTDYLAEILFLVHHDFVFNISGLQGYTLEAMVCAMATQLRTSAETIIFDAYKPPIYEPKVMEIVMERALSVGIAIQDTFIEDLQAFVTNLNNETPLRF